MKRCLMIAHCLVLVLFSSLTSAADKIDINHFKTLNELTWNAKFSAFVEDKFNYDAPYGGNLSSMILEILTRGKDIIKTKDISYGESCMVGNCDSYKVKIIQDDNGISFVVLTNTTITILYSSDINLAAFNQISSFIQENSFFNPKIVFKLYSS